MKALKRHRFAVAVAVFAGFITYAFWIEPSWLEVTHHQIASRLQEDLKIAHLTDLHIRQISRREEKVLAELASQKPDVIVITGDTVSESSHIEPAKAFLQRLSAPLGVYAVEGNWEHWVGRGLASASIVDVPNVRFLKNQNHQIRDGLWIVGFEDAILGNPDETQAFAGVPDGAQCISLFHSPSFFEKAVRKCQLNLSGHTHGGQVRAPLLPPFYLPPGSGPFVSGWYGAPDSRLYVSRGVGTSRVDIRFWCRPEITFITMRAD